MSERALSTALTMLNHLSEDLPPMNDSRATTTRPKAESKVGYLCDQLLDFVERHGAELAFGQSPFYGWS
jgi:hypothetical protein